MPFTKIEMLSRGREMQTGNVKEDRIEHFVWKMSSLIACES